jgi:hypothetical protein
MLADVWDIRYEGLSDPGVAEIKVKSSGDDEYRLSFTNNQGVEYSNVRFLYSNSTGLYYGDDDDALIFTQNVSGVNATNHNIMKNDYFVVSHNGGQDTGVTRVLRLDSVDTSNSLVQMTDAGTGSAVNGKYTGTLGTDPVSCSIPVTGTFNVGGYTYDFSACNTSTTGKGQIQLLVDLDDDGTVGGEAKVVTDGGAMIDLGTQATAGWRQTMDANVTLSTDNANFDDDPGADEVITLQFWVTTTNEVDLDILENATVGLSMKTHEDNDDLKTGMTNYGVLFKELNEDNDPDTLEIQYPLAQLLPQTFVTFSKTVTMEGGAGTITVERPQRIDIGSAVLASQVSDPTAVNVVSVGGSCINSVTAEIMGLTYPACGADSGLSEGEGIVKLFESGEKVAIVVAGWEAEDTTRATRVLADYKAYQEAGQLVGTEVKVTGTSATEFTVTPVSGEAAPADEEAEE